MSGRPDIKKKIQGINYDTKILFSEEEIKTYKKKFKDILKQEYAIVVTGSSNLKIGIREKNSTKTYPTNKFQKIINKEQIKYIQLGIPENDKLEGVLDFRGKTNIRETFFLIKNTKFIICSEGMYAHASSAFNIPCITIFTGYNYPQLTYYKNIIAITPKPLPKCAYCLRSTCIYKHRICLNTINQKEIDQTINKILNK